MIDHVGLEVADLARSARFYDAVLRALGARRVHEGEAAIAYGRTEAVLWIVARGEAPAPGFGHVALRAAGRAAVEAAHAAGLGAGGATTVHRDPGPTTAPPTTRGTCATPTGCAWRWSPAAPR